MKTITTILLLIGLLGCNAQEPDTLTYYSVDYVDSLSNRIELLELIVQINETSVIADTFNFEIVDDRIKVEINKQGYNVWIDVIDGEHRINTNYLNFEDNILIMDGVKTSASLYLP